MHESATATTVAKKGILGRFWPKSSGAHVNVAFWLLRDAFGRSPARLALLILLGLAAAALQATVLMTLYWAASNLTMLERFVVPGTSFEIDRTTMFVIVAGAVLGQATLAALCRYLFAINTIEQWRRYHLHMAENVLAKLAQAVNAGRVDGAGIERDRRFISIFVRSGPRVGILFYRLLHAMSALIRFFVFLALSFYVHAGITVMLLAGALGVGAITVLKFTRNTSQNARLLRERVGGARQEWRRLAHLAGQGDAVSLEDAAAPDAPIGLYHRSFQARFLNVERSRLVTMLTMTALIMATLVVFGSAVLEGQMMWQELTTALVAVFMTMLPLSELAGVMSIFGHYYPDVRLYRGACAALETAGSPADFERFLQTLRDAGSTAKAPAAEDEEE